MTDWTRYEDDADERRCANGEWLGRLMLSASFVGGIVLGYLAWLWVSACP